MKIEVSEKTASFLSQLASRINTQNNHGTASPYYFVVRGTKDKIVPEWSNDNLRYYIDEQVFTEKELEEYCKENECDLEETKGKCLRGAYEEYDEYDNVFLTQEGYDEHIRLNGHNYRNYKNFGFYVKHAFRNPEMASLIEAIKEIGTTLQEST